MKVTVLDWDSGFFQKKVGELILEADDAAIEITEDFDVIYVKSNHNFDLNIQGYQLAFFETKVLFSKKINEVTPANENVYPLTDAAADLKPIYALAFESGKYSRFKLDTRFSEEEFKALYKKWVDNSFVKKFADEVLVFSKENEIQGFVTYKIKDDIATVGLIATAAKKQGTGIGTQLLNEVERKLKEIGVLTLQIPTQLQNEPACKFYAKRGYEIIEETVIKHYWKI